MKKSIKLINFNQGNQEKKEKIQITDIRKKAITTDV